MSTPQQPQKDMTGVLFRNKRKERDNQPDREGTITIEGKQYRVAEWTRTSRGGDEYGSLQVSLPRDKADTQGGGQRTAAPTQRPLPTRPEPAAAPTDDETLPF